MSHVAVVKSEINDNEPVGSGIEALKRACKRLGLDFREGQKTWNWFGEWVNDYHGEDAAYRHGISPAEYGKCEHAIRLPGCAYEIGVKKLPNGNYTLVYDFYGPGRQIMNTLGKGLEKLMQYYGPEKAQLLAKSKGLMTQRKLEQNGDIKLVVLGVK
jgi:hypothetical protein